MGSYVDYLRATRTPGTAVSDNKNQIGHIWMNILIEYNYITGEAKILRSFSKPAKESYIKKITKPKPKVFVPKIDVEEKKVKELF
jgi:hypothetical protein